MSTNPNDPGYEPPGDPKQQVSERGQIVGYDLYLLYTAGRVKFPDMADRFDGFNTLCAGNGAVLQAAAATLGSPPGLTRVHTAFQRMQDTFTATQTSLLPVGETLIEVADAYARTDAEAADRFRQLYDANRGSFGPPSAVGGRPAEVQ